jgi:hypothetical protein
MTLFNPFTPPGREDIKRTLSGEKTGLVLSKNTAIANTINHSVDLLYKNRLLGKVLEDGRIYLKNKDEKDVPWIRNELMSIEQLGFNFVEK